MKSEYDFSQAEQGKFYHPDATFHYRIYLEPDVEQFMTKIAKHKKIDVPETAGGSKPPANS
jgi:hypothetical protein